MAIYLDVINHVICRVNLRKTSQFSRFIHRVMQQLSSKIKFDIQRAHVLTDSPQMIRLKLYVCEINPFIVITCNQVQK